MSNARMAAAAVVAASLSLQACATMPGGGGAPQSAMDRARGTCVATVLGGALLGAVIGNNVGNGSASDGAAVGLVAGGIVCAVLMAMADAEDRAQIAMIQKAALDTGENKVHRYIGKDGRTRTIAVSSREVADPSPPALAATDAGAPISATVTPRVCRAMGTTLSVEGVGTAPSLDDYVCRNPDGVWTPVRAPRQASA